MRTLMSWGLAASLIMGLGAAAARADDESEGSSAKPSARAPTWQWKPLEALFGPKEAKPPPEKKTPAKPEAPAAKKPSAPAKPVAIVDEAATRRSREEANLLRRLLACDKLREIAIQTNDNDLLRRVDELEERVQTTYAQRTADLRGGTGSFESDEKTIDKYLGAGKARSADSSAYTVSGKDHSSRAAVEETKP